MATKFIGNSVCASGQLDYFGTTGICRKNIKNIARLAHAAAFALHFGHLQPLGQALAAARPITASTAPASRACGQKRPPSTWTPGRPTNTVPGPTRRESQLTLVTSALLNPGGTAKPTWRSRGWSRSDIAATLMRLF